MNVLLKLLYLIINIFIQPNHSALIKRYLSNKLREKSPIVTKDFN